MMQFLLCRKAFSPSDGLNVGVGNLSHEEDVFCAAVSDNNHERTIELQDGDMLKGEKCYSDACGSGSRGSSLINVQGSLMNNLQKIRLQCQKGICAHCCPHLLSLPLRLPAVAPLLYHSSLLDH